MASNVDENNPRQDDDILTHCAYAFPGVVYTLGKDSWSLLRNTYLTLAENLPHSMVSLQIGILIYHIAIICYLTLLQVTYS